MGSAEVLNFETLLGGISAELPAGTSLRDDVELSAKFYEVRNARNEARMAERSQRDYETMSNDEKQLEGRPAPPDWDKISSSTTTIIAKHSKDLWVAAWMVEALVRQHGFAGLRDGFRLIRELCERYWDGVHPRPDDEDGLQLTLSQVASLNDILLGPIDEIPLTPAASSTGALTSIDYKEAAALERNSEAKSNVQAEGGTTLESFERAASESTPQFFQDLVDDISETLAEIRQLDAFLEEKCAEADQPDAAPAFSRVMEAVSECDRRIRAFAKALLATGEEMAEDQSGESVQGVESDSSGRQALPTSSVIQTREEAFLALRKISDFFRRTEPHSPVSYTLEQIVRWGGMSLPDLMRDLINDETVRADLFRRTGINDRDRDAND
jgi:type VI secretion system protein ImpA